MSAKSTLSAFVSTLEEADVTVDPSLRTGGLQRTIRHLEEIEFKVASRDGDVTVWLAASGDVREVVIADGALTRHDHRAMAALVGRTIRAAEAVMTEGVRELTRRRLAARSVS